MEYVPVIHEAEGGQRRPTYPYHRDCNGPSAGRGRDARPVPRTVAWHWSVGGDDARPNARTSVSLPIAQQRMPELAAIIVDLRDESPGTST